jgi:hypothetical protein
MAEAFEGLGNEAEARRWRPAAGPTQDDEP